MNLHLTAVMHASPLCRDAWHAAPNRSLWLAAAARVMLVVGRVALGERHTGGYFCGGLSLVRRLWVAGWPRGWLCGGGGDWCGWRAGRGRYRGMSQRQG